MKENPISTETLNVLIKLLRTLQKYLFFFSPSADIFLLGENVCQTCICEPEGGENVCQPCICEPEGVFEKGRGCFAASQASFPPGSNPRHRHPKSDAWEQRSRQAALPRCKANSPSMFGFSHEGCLANGALNACGGDHCLARLLPGRYRSKHLRS
jgi:hypothetical protein